MGTRTPLKSYYMWVDTGSDITWSALNVLSALKVWCQGRNSHMRSAVSRCNTATAIEEPITPPVKVKYTLLLINGQFVNSASGKKFKMYDPRTGDVIAEVAEGDAEDINCAVSASRKGFDEGPWPKMTA